MVAGVSFSFCGDKPLTTGVFSGDDGSSRGVATATAPCDEDELESDLVHYKSHDTVY